MQTMKKIEKSDNLDKVSTSYIENWEELKSN
jgi:hypothetical protein